MAEPKKTTVITPKFRISFPHLFKPRDGFDGGEPKYSMTMLFEKGADITALKKAVNEAIKEKWPAKAPAGLKSPFRDQGEKDYEGYVEGAVFVNATAKQKPQVVNRDLDEILDASEIYPGCWCRAEINAFAYDTKGNRGVSFGMNSIQKIKDGPSIGGRRPANKVFTVVEDDDLADADPNDLL